MWAMKKQPTEKKLATIRQAKKNPKKTQLRIQNQEQTRQRQRNQSWNPEDTRGANADERRQEEITETDKETGEKKDLKTHEVTKQ